MSLDGLRALPFVQRGNGLSLVFNKKGLEDWSKLTRLGERRSQTHILRKEVAQPLCRCATRGAGILRSGRSDVLLLITPSFALYQSLKV
jgi:hypothetical protein